MAEIDVFKHSTPSLYDRFMGPLLFEPYARHVAEHVAVLLPDRILETAAGTCLFGVMFFPDKVRANAEARRVLRTGGRYVLLTFDRLALNPIPKVAGAAVASLFADDPRYMERGPFSYNDPALVEGDLRAAGFEDIELETVELSSRVAAHEAAQGIVLGSPFRAEIERLDPSALERAVTAVTEALRPWDGKNAPMSAHIATATR
jgi:SAM-dependent methyltransferase